MLVTKKKLVERLRNKVKEDGRTNISKEDIGVFLNILNKTIEELLVEGNEVSFKGMFKVKLATIPARVIANPKTRDLMNIPARRGVKFSVNPEFKVRIR